MGAFTFDPDAALAAARGSPAPCYTAKAANPATERTEPTPPLAGLAGLARSQGGSGDDYAERAAIIAEGTGWPDGAANAFAVVATLTPPPDLAPHWPAVVDLIGRALEDRLTPQG